MFRTEHVHRKIITEDLEHPNMIYPKYWLEITGIKVQQLNFANVTTAQMSWKIQNFLVITLLKY